MQTRIRQTGYLLILPVNTISRCSLPRTRITCLKMFPGTMRCWPGMERQTLTDEETASAEGDIAERFSKWDITGQMDLSMRTPESIWEKYGQLCPEGIEGPSGSPRGRNVLPSGATNTCCHIWVPLPWVSGTRPSQGLKGAWNI